MKKTFRVSFATACFLACGLLALIINFDDVGRKAYADISCTPKGVSMPAGSSCANIGSLSVTGYGDVNQLLASTDRNVVTTAALSTTRTWTMTSANALPPGGRVTVCDRAIGVTSVNTLTIARGGTDTFVLGGVAVTSVILNSPGGCIGFVSDAASKWLPVMLVGVTAPLVRNTTTGNVTCPTCATTTNGGALTATAPVAISAAGVISITGVAGQVLAGATPAFTSTPTLGASGTLGSLTFGNATSGTVLVQPVAGALGTPTQSLPTSTGTFAVAASGPLVLNATSGNLTLNCPPVSESHISGTNATYTTPTCSGATARVLDIILLGSAGGSAGSGTTPGAATNGGATCWNTSGTACTSPVYSAGGGSLGTTNGTVSAGGTITGTGTCLIPLSGGNGGNGAAAITSPGGAGGISAFGGAGPPPPSGITNGLAPAPNTGSGGSGAGSGATANAGGGGAAGAYCRATITTPAASYVYTVGVGGTAGSAGTGGASGIGGANGLVAITASW